MKRRVSKGVAAVIGIIIITFILVHPYFPSHEVKNGAELIISTNFGKRTIEIFQVSSNQTVMKALESCANVTTAYGGKFVTSIDGIGQNSTYFWFYYVNGILANVGASEYILRPGDVVRWDFHPWKIGETVYSEIQDFPEPLLHGYGGKVYSTEIAFQKGYKKYAEELENYLTGIGINASISDNPNAKSKNVIIIGYTQIAEKINKEYKKFGWIYHVENGTIVNPYGKTYHGAFVEITQSPFNPMGLGSCENVVIWFYATSEVYMEKAIKNVESGNVNTFWYFTGELE